MASIKLGNVTLRYMIFITTEIIRLYYTLLYVQSRFKMNDMKQDASLHNAAVSKQRHYGEGLTMSTLQDLHVPVCPRH